MARLPPLVTLPLHQVEGVATAIALVTAPHKGGLCNDQLLPGLVFSVPGYSPHCPAPPFFKGGQQMIRMSCFLAPTGLSLHWVRSHPHHQCFACRSYGWKMTSHSTPSNSMLMCYYYGVPMLSFGSIKYPCEVVLLLGLHSRLQLKGTVQRKLRGVESDINR